LQNKKLAVFNRKSSIATVVRFFKMMWGTRTRTNY